MRFQFRIAENSDLAAIQFLDAHCFPTDSLDLQPAAEGELESGIEAGEILLALSEADVVGMIQWRQHQNETEILTLAIWEPFRGVGLGRALLNEFLTMAFPTPISCLTAPGNLPMRTLLAKTGFHELGLIQNHYGPGRDRLRYLR